jgi:predicted Zn-dependent protease
VQTTAPGAIGVDRKHAALNLWQKMAQAEQGGTPAFLSTHPASSTRLSDLQALLPRVVPLYQAAAKS